MVDFLDFSIKKIKKLLSKNTHHKIKKMLWEQWISCLEKDTKTKKEFQIISNENFKQRQK